MKIQNIAAALLLFVTLFVSAQKKDSVIAKPLSQYPPELLKTDEYGNKYYYDERQMAKIYSIDGETVVVMDEIILTAKPHFNNQLDRNFYFFLNKKLNRVYPLFLTALEQYRTLNTQLAAMSDADRRRYSRQKQEELANEYEAKLRDLTTTEGQVFTKLMYRATGKTVYEIIRDLRGGWSAFWWNIKGNIAEVNIKEAYDPHRNRQDEYIESLLQSNWNAGYLQPYPGYKDFKVTK